MKPDHSNKYFQMAVEFVNLTAKHIFLTGKAGTGKTTFLKYIQETSHKKLAIVAPTGVAAINAGGVTIHSLFQLPFGSFLPTSRENIDNISGNFYNKQSLFRKFRFSNDKRQLIQELDLLIIDEVSMVRADLLDAVDTVLRSIRKKPNLPFGGLQMLYIGDLSQLPPVVNDREWDILSQYYESPFFFHAKVIESCPPTYLELRKIYRQSDRDFINILNNVRNNTLKKEDLALLNQYYQPDFKPEKKGEYITLTTHNAKADIINQKELQKLPGVLHTFDAHIDGEFNERSYPAESRLQLKEGAQIMFIRNDKGEERRYYNGKLGTIKSIKGDEITIMFPDNTTTLVLEKEEWKNIRYHYDKEQDQIVEEELGTFIQYPIRLAWAITIHKSQGLTFNKAIIDAGQSFAPGQVYVALSRLTSLDGLVLFSRIRENCISTDAQANAFAATAQEEGTLQQALKEEQQRYTHDFLLSTFDWEKIVSHTKAFYEAMETRKIPMLEEAKSLAKELLEHSRAHQNIAETFRKKLQHLLIEADKNGYQYIHERISAANKYFSDTLYNDLFVPLEKHFEEIKGKSRVKKYLEDLNNLVATYQQKKSSLGQAVQITEGLVAGIDSSLLFKSMGGKHEQDERFKLQEIPTKLKPAKGESQRTSLALFKSGKSIEEIATERGLALSTIQGHLVSFIETGEVAIEEFVPKEKIITIQLVIDEVGDVPSSQIKERLGEEYSYADIKAVLNYRKFSSVKS